MTSPIFQRGVVINVVRVRDEICAPSHRMHGHDQIFRGVLDGNTGTIRFPQNIQVLDFGHRRRDAGTAQWQEVEMVVSERDGRPHFEIHVSYDRMDDFARRVIEETLFALNQIAHYAKDAQIELDLSKLHSRVEEREVQQLPGWKGKIGRVEAEELLKDAPVGSYLIRTDLEETEAMIEALAQSNNTPVWCCIVTVVETEDRIADMLLLCTSYGWTVRQDSQDLRDLVIYQYELSASHLIEMLSSRLVNPV